MIYRPEIKVSEYASTGGVAVDLASDERMEFVQLCYKACGSRLEALQESRIAVEAALHDIDQLIQRELMAQGVEK